MTKQQAQRIWKDYEARAEAAKAKDAEFCDVPGYKRVYPQIETEFWTKIYTPEIDRLLSANGISPADGAE